MKKQLLVLVCFCLVCVSGCLHSRPSRFYLLQALENTEGSSAGDRQISLGVGPVELPDYLSRSLIARRAGGSEIKFSESDRWAEPLGKSMLRVLAENLSLLLGTKQVELFPWRTSSRFDYQVRMRITRFDGSADEVLLIAYWSILDGRKAAELVARKSTITEPTQGAGIQAIVSAHNSAFEKLSREIAAELRRLSSGG